MPCKKKVDMFLWYWMPFILYVSVIFFFSHLSQPTGTYVIPVNDKVIHFCEFFILTVLALRAFYNSGSSRVQKQYVVAALLFSLMYGVVDEVHQFFVPGRTCSLLDYCADAGGVVAGTLISRIHGVGALLLRWPYGLF